MKRVSSLTRLARCQSADITAKEAHRELGIPLELESQESVLGTAYHKLAERWQKGETVTVDEVCQYAYKAGVDKEDLIYLWGTLSQDSFERAPIMAVEELLVDEALGLSQHPDLVRFWPERKLLRVDDWKTGRLEDDARSNAQIRTYCALEWKKYSTQLDMEGAPAYEPIQRVVGNLIYLRSSSSTVEFNAKEIAEEYEGVAQLMESVTLQESLPINERAYRTGDHCRYCEGRAICPAFRKDAQIALMITMDLKPDMSTVPMTRKGTPNKVKLASARQAALVAKCTNLLETQPDKAWSARTVAGSLKDALQQAFKDHIEFYGPLECVDGNIIDIHEGMRTPLLNVDHVLEALGWAEVDPVKRAAVLDRLTMRTKVSTSTMRKQKPK